MIRRAARLLELDVASQVVESLAEARQAEIDGLESALKRKTAGALFRFSQAHPVQANRLLDALCTPLGFRYLGAGVEFSAYLDTRAEEVIKIHRGSATVTPADRQTIAENIARGHAALRKGLGLTTLEQTVTIGPHILGGYETVRIHQPMVEFTAADTPFSVNVASVDPVKLEEIVARVPGADAGLEEFVGRSRLLYGTDRLVPDTNGQNNVVVRPDGSITLLDTCPIDSQVPVVQSLVLSQLASLKEELAVIHN